MFNMLKAAMLESPVLQELLAELEVESCHKHLLRVLRAQFGAVPEELDAAVKVIQQTHRLEGLLDWAAQCPDLNAFRDRLGQP
jgi:hypothetical protein